MWKLRDYLIFFLLIPFALILIFMMPQEIKVKLILEPQNPTLLSIFMSNYAHTYLGHLSDNLFPYLLVIFLIFRIETDRKHFYGMSIFILLILPFILSLLMIRFPTGYKYVQGFSGLVAAFVGYFAYVIFKNLQKNYSSKLNNSFIWLVLAINLLVLGIDFKNLGAIIILFLAACSMIYMNRIAFYMILKQLSLKLVKLQKGRFIARIYGVALFFLTLYFLVPIKQLIPTVIRTNIGTTNIFLHYWGYLLGILSPLIVNYLGKHRRNILNLFPFQKN